MIPISDAEEVGDIGCGGWYVGRTLRFSPPRTHSSFLDHTVTATLLIRCHIFLINLNLENRGQARRSSVIDSRDSGQRSRHLVSIIVRGVRYPETLLICSLYVF